MDALPALSATNGFLLGFFAGTLLTMLALFGGDR